MLYIAGSHCILNISRDFYPKFGGDLELEIRQRLGTETT